MGLDMYLFRRLRDGSAEDQEAAYWRKANHIHKWFVDHVQDGVDDCKFHNEFTKERIEELLDTCQTVIEQPHRAEELLPTKSGFFFGSTSYDDSYFEEVESTIRMLNVVLEETDFDTEAIYYLSWW